MSDQNIDEEESLFNLEPLTGLAIDQFNASVEELKEINTTLTEISKTSNMTSAELKRLGEEAFAYASQYGTAVNDYLLGAQKMLQAGYKNAGQMAELSALVQSANSISADLADSYMIASDAAYGYSGNIEKLTEFMDGQTQVANRNAVSMEELANASQAAAAIFSDISMISEKEMTALLGAGISASGESGETVARALKSIFMGLQGTTGEGGFDGEIIDGEALEKAEARCRSVGVALEDMRNGVTSLREPMEILKDLSDIYAFLPENSAQKTGILSDIGGENGSAVLSGILSNWDTVEKMLGDYENASGSMMEGAMKSANSLEGSLNRLGNTWTDTVGNIVDSGILTGAVNGLNSLLSIVSRLTSALGTMGSTALAGGGIFAFLQKDKSKQRFCPSWA